MTQTMTNGQDTRRALLLAAGELFADHGREGTSVRDIVKKAGATLSSVNYHFGSKDQLYLEAIRHVLSEKVRRTDLFASVSQQEPHTPQEIADTLGKMLRKLFLSYLAPDEPQWYGRLINRAIIDFCPEVDAIFAEVVWPAHEGLKDVLLRHLPRTDPHEADLWVISVFAQIHHYLMAKNVVNWSLSRKDYDEPFLDEVAAYIARSAVVTLGLPEPQPHDF